ncbi:PhzF family phenazine biosynthesis protein [Carnobacterium gallinarum]|uniref:PhzF family phenazine biosynthesis protein n=1 Tax=Carnobacterium gallinarum TaxID=2749 RepID=UPI00055410DC|nr:PhzF family phenazine biosynthesis protein [Carnobacterium gallinarum]
MGKIKVSHYQVFSRVANQGNPAGVVFGGENLTTEEMQTIAKKVGFNETAFVLPPQEKETDYRIRFFTPGHEMDLCGHGTMAAVWGIIQKIEKKDLFYLETKAGVLAVRYQQKTEELLMEQASARFLPFIGEVKDLCEAIGITMEELDLRYPILYGSTGVWTLLVPIKKLSSFEKMKPKNHRFSEILVDNPYASVHPFSLETYDFQVDLHGRHFSSSFSGTTEDPVTGTASGVMGAYYLEQIAQNETKVSLFIEQGNEMGRPGLVRVLAEKSSVGTQVMIAGIASFVEELEIDY